MDSVEFFPSTIILKNLLEEALYMPKVECNGCGDLVEKKPIHIEEHEKHYCSPKCRRNKIEVECDNCGKKFKRKPSTADGNNYCDLECRNDSYKDTITFNCQNCGKEASHVRSKYERHDNHFCSKECSHEFRSKEHEPNIECDQCDKEVYVKPYRIKEDKNMFCSNQCKGKYYEENDLLKEENHPRWKGGPNDAEELRQSSLYMRWRKTILERDDYTCQDCNRKGVTLQVHHIEPVRKAPEKVMDEENVVTLCLKCHQKRHPDVHIIDVEKEFKQVKLDEISP